MPTVVGTDGQENVAAVFVEEVGKELSTDLNVEVLLGEAVSFMLTIKQRYMTYRVLAVATGRASALVLNWSHRQLAKRIQASGND